MKKNELKKILKPLIKECIKECIFEDGVLSGIITEVAKGMAGQRIVAESVVATKNTPDSEKMHATAMALEEQRQERIKKLNESVSLENNIFEGTQEIIPEGNNHSPLAGTAPGDSGVDITGIVSLANGKWKHLV